MVKRAIAGLSASLFKSVIDENLLPNSERINCIKRIVSILTNPSIDIDTKESLSKSIGVLIVHKTSKNLTQLIF